MLLKLHPENPSPRNLKKLVNCLKKGGVVIYPTDSVYGMGCDINQPKAIEKVCQIKGVDPSKAQFSFICHDLSHLSTYTKSIDTPLFRTLKRSLPGPFTFILPASKKVPKLMKTKKDTVGIRVPDNVICQSIIGELGNPIMNTSLPEGPVEEMANPEIIHEQYKNLVDIVVDGGIGGTEPSTVVDCTKGDEPKILRKGAGHLALIA